jgi:hypothetical protein
MITPKLTAVMVAMTLMGSAPAAFAQLDVSLATGDATNFAAANTGGNSIESVVVANQEASNEINVEQENEAENEGGDATAIALAESKGCDKCGGSSGTSAEAEAEGGDVENEQENVAVVIGNEQSIEQEQEVEVENSIETGDVEQDQTAQTGIINIRDILIQLGLGGGGNPGLPGL